MSRFGLGMAAVCLMVGCAHGKSTPVMPADAQVASPAQSQPEPAPNSESSEPSEAQYAEAANASWIGGAPESKYVTAGEEHFGIWVEIPEAIRTGGAPMAISLAIDTSGSMSGDKIAHARESARRLVEQLDDGDVVSIATFSSRVRTPVAPTPLTPRSRAHVLAVIEELGASGGTAMFDGLRVARAQLDSSPETHFVRRLVVISDGKATVGASSPEVFGQLAESGVPNGVQITSFGVGLKYDEATLNALAIRSSGRLYHLENTKELAQIVKHEVDLLDSTVATDVHVEIIPAPGVTLTGTDKARWTRTRRGVVVPLGAMFAGQQRELLVKANVMLDEQGARPLASLRFHYRDPARHGIERVRESLIEAAVTHDHALVREFEIDRTQTLIAMREAHALTLVAAGQANSGELTLAAANLEKAENELRQQAKRAKSKKAKTRMLGEASKMKKSRDRANRARSAPPAAKADESRRMALEFNDDAMAGFGY